MRLNPEADAWRIMEKLAENRQEQNDQTTKSPDLLVGSILREAREKLGMSIEDIAVQTSEICTKAGQIPMSS